MELFKYSEYKYTLEVKKSFTQTSFRIFLVKSTVLTSLQYATQEEIKV